MKKTSFILLFAVFACSNEKKNETEAEREKKPLPKEQYVNHVKAMEEKMRASKMLDAAVANEAIRAYSEFAFSFPEDSSSADYLFKAGEVATSIGNYQQALIYYKTINDKYPKFNLVVESLYLQGFIYDNYMNDDNNAREIYTKLIKDYPQHKLAEDAKAAINNLGKTDEQLIEEFKKKNK
jgi:TolA-binding protein